MNKSPEQKAREDFDAMQADHATAKVIALEVVTEQQPVGFGEVVDVIKSKGISEHIASQAIDSMTGRSIDTTPVGELITK